MKKISLLLIFIIFISFAYSLSVSINKPINNENIFVNYTAINISITGDDIQIIRLDFNGSNKTVYDEDLIVYMNFNNNSLIGEHNNFTKDLSRYNNSGQISGARFNKSINNRNGYTITDNLNEYINIPNSYSLSNLTGNFSIGTWVYFNEINQWQPIIVRESSCCGMTSLFLANDNKPSVIINNFNPVGINFYAQTEQWYFIVLTYDISKGYANFTVYNDTNAENPFNEALTNYGTTLQGINAPLRIGETPDLRDDGSFLIDSFFMYNRTLKKDEIEFLYNHKLVEYENNKYYFLSNITNTKSGHAYIKAYVSNSTNNINSDEITIFYNANTISINLISPVNNTNLNSPIWINFTTNINSDCSLNNSQYWNKTVDTGTAFSFQDNGSIDNDYSIKISCFSDESPTNSSEILFFTKDTSYPVITWSYPLLSNTSISEINNSVALNILIEDNNLFAYECEVRNENNILKYNISASGLSVGSVNINNNILTDSEGNWTVNCEASDSHTKKKIPDYKYKKSEDKIIFEFEKIINYEKIRSNISIQYTGKHTLENINITKSKDRYKFKYQVYLGDKKFSKSVKHSFKIRCGDIFYIPKSQYKAHFVCYGQKKWVDFENPDILNYQVTKCENEKDCWDIDIDMKSKEIFEFSSIGGLNIIQQEAVIQVNEISSVFNPPELLNIGNSCPDTVADILIFAFLFLILSVMYIVCKYIIRYGIITLVISVIGGLFYGFALIGCSPLLGGLFIAFGLVLGLVEAFN